MNAHARLEDCAIFYVEWAHLEGAESDHMRNDQRQFFIYDLEIAARKNDAEIPDLATVVAVWEKLRASGQTYPVRNGDATLVIGDIKHDTAHDALTLLIRISDKKSPNSVYSDLGAGSFQEHIKVGDQGSDFGCHVLISKKSEIGLANTYTTLIEKVPNISYDLVRRILSKFLNYEHNANQGFYTYPHPNGGLTRAGQPRTDRCCPHIELRGRPSDTFINDLNNGRLTGVSLVKTEGHTPVGGAAYLVKKSSELLLGIDHNNLPANVWPGLKAAILATAAAYPVAKIAYKMPGLNRTVTVDVDAATGAPLEDLYVKSVEFTGITPFLAQSAQTVVPHLEALAIQELIKHRTV